MKKHTATLWLTLWLAPTAFLPILLGGCSGGEQTAALNANSSSGDIAREAAALEKKAEETAISIEAESNDEISRRR